MRLLVTGAHGRLGRWVVEELRGDHEIVAASLDAPPDGGDAADGVRHVRADLTDPADVARVMDGAEAVVHLAAIPSPIGQEPERVFANNMLGAFHVVEAAMRAGARKVIYSGSGSALGFAFRFRAMTPDYMPMDEAHPLRPQDAYGLSKQLGEEILEAATRRTGIRTISLRPTTVIEPGDYRERVPRMLDDARRPEGGGIFAYVDARDFARAVRAALDDRTVRHDRFFVTADDAMSREPLAVAFPRRFPGSEAACAALTGTEGPISCAKAKRILGYRPRHSWRSEPDAGAP